MGDIEEEDIWRYGRRVVDSLMFHSQTLSETTSWCVDRMKVCRPDLPGNNTIDTIILYQEILVVSNFGSLASSTVKKKILVEF